MHPEYFEIGRGTLQADAEQTTIKETDCWTGRNTLDIKCT